VWYCGKECQQKDWSDHKVSIGASLNTFSFDRIGLLVLGFFNNGFLSYHGFEQKNRYLFINSTVYISVLDIFYGFGRNLPLSESNKQNFLLTFCVET
jgi:hypothetical protein